MRSSPAHVRQSIQQAGSQIVSPRGAALSTASAPAYRKQKEWQELVDRISAEHLCARDAFLQELWQMREQLADAQCEYAELRNRMDCMCAAQEQAVGTKDNELQALQARLRGATIQEIQAKKTAALEEATCQAQSRASEMAAMRSDSALAAKTVSALTRERDLEAKIMRMQSHEVEVQRSATESLLNSAALCKQLEDRLAKVQEQELEMQQSMALEETTQLANWNHLEASLKLSQRHLFRMEASATARCEELQGEVASAVQQQRVAQEAQLSREDDIATLRCEQASCAQQMEVQKIEMQRAAAVTEASFSSKCQRWEAEVQEARSASELAFSAQLRAMQVKVEDVEAEVLFERKQFAERLQALDAELGCEKALGEKRLQSYEIEAKRVAATDEAGLNAKLCELHAALDASKRRAEHAQEVAINRQRALQADVHNARERQQELQRVATEAAAVHAAKLGELQEAAEKRQLHEIQLRHELARAHVEAEGERRAHHFVSEQAKLALARSESAGQAAQHSCEVRLEAARRREIEDRQMLIDFEAAAAEKADALEVSLQQLHVRKIEVERAAAEIEALSAAKCQELEVHMEQLRSDESTAKMVAEAKVDSIQEELAMAEEKAESAKHALVEQQEERRHRHLSRVAAPGVVIGEKRHLERMAAVRNKSAEPRRQLPGGQGDVSPPFQPSAPRDSPVKRRPHAPGAEAGAGIGK